MLTRNSAEDLVGMLRRGDPAEEIAARALSEFPTLEHLRPAMTESRLHHLALELAGWIEGNATRKPVPGHVRGLWFSVALPLVQMQPHPETTQGEEWELLDHWADSPWQPALFREMADDSIAGEELAVVVLAALLRDVAARKLVSLSHAAAGPLALEVRPDCAYESITVGLMEPDGFSTSSARQNLW
jgi:hypothetical protein